MASNTSKTARASVRAGQSSGGALSVLGEFKYVIPLDGGKHAYVRNLTTGKTTHLSTDSDAFAEEIRTLAAAGHGAKLRAEFDALAAAHPTARLGSDREAPRRSGRLRRLIASHHPNTAAKAGASRVGCRPSSCPRAAADSYAISETRTPSSFAAKSTPNAIDGV